MEPHALENLGARERPADPRDLQLGAVQAPQYAFLPFKTNNAAWEAVVEYQGGQPACGAHSGAKLANIKQGRRYSPRFQWADIKTFDGFAIEDGTDMRSIFKSLCGSGSLDYPLLTKPRWLAT